MRSNPEARGLYYKTASEFFSVNIYGTISFLIEFILIKFVCYDFAVGYGENIFIVQAPAVRQLLVVYSFNTNLFGFT